MVAENLAHTGIRSPDLPARNAVAIDLIKVMMGTQKLGGQQDGKDRLKASY